MKIFAFKLAIFLVLSIRMIFSICYDFFFVFFLYYLWLLYYRLTNQIEITKEKMKFFWIAYK